MALTYTKWYDENGVERLNVHSDLDNPHILLTGPVLGHVALEDGSTIDVSAPAIECESREHALTVAHAIGRHHEKLGTFGPGWKYDPTATVIADDEAGA